MVVKFSSQMAWVPFLAPFLTEKIIGKLLKLAEHRFFFIYETGIIIMCFLEFL